VWRTAADGVPNGPPATVRDEKSQTTRVFWATPRGDVTCNELRGDLLWKQRLKGALSQGPVALSTAVGAVAVVGDDKGRLWFVDGDGGVRMEGSLDGRPVADALRAHAFSPDEPQAVLALLRDGTLVRLAQVGTEVWRVGTGLKEGHIGRLAGVRGAFGPLCVAGVRGSGQGGAPQWAAEGRDAAGVKLWRTDLPAAVVQGPVSENTAAEARSWRAGLEDGSIVEIDAEKGGSSRTWKISGGLPVTALAGPLAGIDAKRPAATLVAANTAAVCAFGPEDSPLWSLPLPNVCCLVTSPGGEMVVAGTNSGELVCINTDGTVRWRDTLAAGAVRGITALPITGDRCAILYGAADGFVTALDGGPLRPEM